MDFWGGDRHPAQLVRLLKAAPDCLAERRWCARDLLPGGEARLLGRVPAYKPTPKAWSCACRVVLAEKLRAKGWALWQG